MSEDAPIIRTLSKILNVTYSVTETTTEMRNEGRHCVINGVLKVPLWSKCQRDSFQCWLVCLLFIHSFLFVVINYLSHIFFCLCRWIKQLRKLADCFCSYHILFLGKINHRYTHTHTYTHSNTIYLHFCHYLSSFLTTLAGSFLL